MGFGLDLGQSMCFGDTRLETTSWNTDFRICCSVVVVVGYVATVLVCITMQAPLMDNPNRAGTHAFLIVIAIFILTSSFPLSVLRLPRHRAASCRIFVRNEELDPVFAARSGERIREAELRPSLGRARRVSGRRYPRLPMDPQPPAIRPPDPGPAEGDVWRGRLCAALHHRADVAEARQGVLLPVLLHRPVSVKLPFARR